MGGEGDGGSSSVGGRYTDYAHDKRIIIYPVYINSKASLADGRRIATEQCVENPTLQEIMEVLKHLGYNPLLEDKIYPRDALARGRVRVNLRDIMTGELTVPDITSRKQLLRKLGEAIPNLKSRKEPGAKAPAPASENVGLPALPMVPGMGPGTMPVGMPAMPAMPQGMPPGMMPPGMMPPGMAGMLPPGMAGMLPPGMAGMLPPGMAGMLPPGMAGMLQGMGMGPPQPGPGEGKVKGGKKKGRK